jgi:hypothetical protein
MDAHNQYIAKLGGSFITNHGSVRLFYLRESIQASISRKNI